MGNTSSNKSGGRKFSLNNKSSNAHSAQNIKQHFETASKTGTLNLSNKKLSEIPSQEIDVIGSSLRSLDLSSNSIETLPSTSDINSLQNLKNLSIHHNRLTTFPLEWATTLLAKIENLDLSSNSIQNLPVDLFKGLQKLKIINLSKNLITKFPESLISLPKLDTINLNDNKLTSLDCDFSSLKATELSVNRNQISVLSKSLGRCENLKTLRLEENNLKLAEIHVEILGESKISTLQVEGNLFTDKEMKVVEGYDEYLERFSATRRKMD